jgi:hypothetical protein
MLILDSGFESIVRSKLTLTEDELPNDEINNGLTVELAESKIIKKVPTYKEITEEVDLIFLKSAIISQLCADLCLTVPNRINVEVSTLDIKWKKDRVDWKNLRETLLGEVDDQLLGIESVPVLVGYDSTIVGKISNTRTTIGED